MKKFLKKFETAMMAVAFAEAGEFDTAREIMKEDDPRKTDRPRIRRHHRIFKRKELRAD
jgi:hypothetical protein